MIIDSFIFYNEFDLLECRLEYLYNHVDYFVICECNFTHAGNSKPMNFLLNADRYKKYLDKIRYCPLYVDQKKFNFDIKINECNYDTDFWTLERMQHNHISTALVEFDDDTVVLCSDLDEIPNIDAFPAIQEALKSTLAVSLIQQSFYYDLCHRHPNFGWPFPAAGKKKDMIANTPNWFRANAMRIFNIGNAGWHLSYFMDTALIQNKLRNFAHQEYNNDTFTDEQKIINNMKNHFDPLGRIALERPKRSDFPEHFLNVFGKYYPTPIST